MKAKTRKLLGAALRWSVQLAAAAIAIARSLGMLK